MSILIQKINLLMALLLANEIKNVRWTTFQNKNIFSVKAYTSGWGGRIDLSFFVLRPCALDCSFAYHKTYVYNFHAPKVSFFLLH